MQYSQQWHRGRLSNVYPRFSRRWSYNAWPRDRVHPSPNSCRGGSKSVKFGVVFHIAWLWAARVWKCSMISEFWKKMIKQQWSLCVLCKFGAVRSTHPWEIYTGIWALVKNLTAKLCCRLFDFAQILHRVWIQDARSTTKVQGPEVKGQGHSVT